MRAFPVLMLGLTLTGQVSASEAPADSYPPGIGQPATGNSAQPSGRPLGAPRPIAPLGAAPDRSGFTLPVPSGQITEVQPLSVGAKPEAVLQPKALTVPRASPRLSSPPVLRPGTEPAKPPLPASPAPSTPKIRKGEAEILLKAPSDSRPTFDQGTMARTAQAAKLYGRIAEGGGWPKLPPLVLKPGDKGAGIMLLKQRLATSSDLSPDALGGDEFDAAVFAAVKTFQARHGLSPSGIVSEATLKAMNVPASIRARQLSASVQRLSGSMFGFGNRYVVVNIPAVQVEAVENGAVVRRHLAVVGKPDRPSPLIETTIVAANFNPTWTAPASIVKKDIIPHMRKDSAWLSKAKIRIFDSHGESVSPAAIDWSGEDALRYTLRQDAGAGNALGSVRIDMPNTESVYMHDTPSQKLFAQGFRFHSSGCVRVSQVRDFAAWLLKDNPESWDRMQIDALIAKGNGQDVRLAKSVPVAWVYLTGYVTPDGETHFRDDVYGWDGKEGIAAR